MSQLATARSAPRLAPTALTSPRRQPLRVVTGAPPSSQVAFASLCVGLVLAGFLAVLLINTSLAQGTYRLSELQRTSAGLSVRADALSHQLDAASTPGVLAQRASALGMVQSPSTAFIRLSDGRILGTATVATPANALLTRVAAAKPAAAKPAAAKPAAAKPPTTPGTAPTTTKKTAKAPATPAKTAAKKR